VYKTKDCTELQSICLQGTCVQTPKQPGKPEQIQTGNADVKDKTQLSSRKELVMPITVKQTLVWNEFYIGEKKHVFSETPVVSQWIVEVATKNISILPDSTIIQQRGRLTRNLGLDFGKNELKYYSCDKTENKIKCSWYKTEFTVLPSCMDLDDGDNERVTGSIGGMKENGELQIQPVSDNCIDKKTLREYFCEEKGGLSYISSKEVLCENFCRNGACVDK
jgi:hypothetical protein